MQQDYSNNQQEMEGCDSRSEPDHIGKHLRLTECTNKSWKKLRNEEVIKKSKNLHFNTMKMKIKNYISNMIGKV